MPAKMATGHQARGNETGRKTSLSYCREALTTNWPVGCGLSDGTLRFWGIRQAEGIPRRLLLRWWHAGWYWHEKAFPAPGIQRHGVRFF